ncbi:hypothetical protein SAMN05421820_104152 [Pedobacter steynii]|uniref:Uncharacterized protein n=1 Tax=Pedobacter steynii TaxID=430522 RepID=A0A1G9UF24_9SPHI|nr:hypothetical protein [Pedobacter steynii]NQX40748.1 hypothetical protein [Pedobacter steynii]SDM58423.1 hypothetical protein SAMN05421820_104152 [Pedobacter steynii]
MNPYKYSGLGSFCILIMLMATLISCEKAIDNSVPEGTPGREAYNTQIKTALTNDSVWVTQFMNKNKASIKVGFAFMKDGNANLYKLNYTPITVIQQLRKAIALRPADAVEINSLIAAFGGLADATLRNILITNPANISFKESVDKFFPLTLKGPSGRIELSEGTNTYNIYGSFNTSLTFLNSSFLSDLKKDKDFDFDFLIKSYHRDSIGLEGYYGPNMNRQATIKPVLLTDMRQHINARNLSILSLGFSTELRVAGKAIATDGATYLDNQFSESYDKANKCLVFKAITGQTPAPELANITALKATETAFTPGDAKPVAGTVIAKYIGYDAGVKESIKNGTVVELVVK